MQVMQKTDYCRLYPTLHSVQYIILIATLLCCLTMLQMIH